MTVSFMRLLAEHDAIGRAVDGILATAAGACRSDEASGRLDALAAQVIDHIAHEDDFIYPELVPPPHVTPSDAAAQFAAEFVALRDDWTRYLDCWTRPRIAADWPGFRDASAAILPRMLDRLRRENQCLYPLALRRGAISLR